MRRKLRRSVTPRLPPRCRCPTSSAWRSDASAPSGLRRRLRAVIFAVAVAGKIFGPLGNSTVEARFAAFRQSRSVTFAIVWFPLGGWKGTPNAEYSRLQSGCHSATLARRCPSSVRSRGQTGALIAEADIEPQARRCIDIRPWLTGWRAVTGNAAHAWHESHSYIESASA